MSRKKRDSILRLYYVGMQVVQGGNRLNPASQHTQTERRGRREGGKERGRLQHTAMRKRVRANDGIDPPTMFLFLFFCFLDSVDEHRVGEHALDKC